MPDESTESYPIYDRSNAIAGYDADTGRWRDGEGRFATREEIMASTAITAGLAGRAVAMPNHAQASVFAERLETMIGGLDRTALEESEHLTDPMPAAILAMMRLSEYYTRSEGDVFQVIEAPLDIALKPLDFSSPDTGFRDALEELYSEEHLDMWQNLYYFWMCSAIYGQAFPLEMIDKNKPENSKLLLIPPKNVDVGRTFILGHGLSIRPFGSEQWTKDLMETSFPAMTYTLKSIDFNESAVSGRNVAINPERCFPIREKSLPFQRYAIPPIVRASRAISTRRIFEEMRRATVEGHKNQLWLFLLGDEENMPLPQEIGHLGDSVAGLYGERTGALVWAGNLRVEVIAPQAPDTLMANETYVGLTVEIFRRMGISLKVISGERGPLGGGVSKAGDIDLDLSILLERLTFRVNQIYRWERQFRRKLAAQMGKSAVEANKKTKVSFGHIGLQVERDIREKLLPSYQAGVMSIQTYLEEGGWEWLVELKNKEEEDKYKELFSPPASFSQTVVDPDGGEKKETKQTPSPGRPRDDNSDLPKKVSNEAKAGIYLEAQSSFSGYVDDVYELFDRLTRNRDIEAFIDELKSRNRTWMQSFALDGYRSGGGAVVQPEGIDNWTEGAVSFVNSFTDGFRERLESVVDDPVALEGARWNAFLYPQEGRHLAYMYGLQWALKERGARGWRRVLHPELSATGPCDMCLRDSTLVHGIDEPFFEFHPNGVCSEQAIAFYTDQQFPTIEIPVPRKIFDPGRILEVLKEMGHKVKQIIRRVRGD